MGIICTPIQLYKIECHQRTTMDGRHAYVGYNGSVSSSDTCLEINGVFAALLNLSEDEPV